MAFGALNSRRFKSSVLIGPEDINVDKSAGGGKTFNIILKLDRGKCIFTSTTGATSAQIKGKTIHRFIRLKEFQTIEQYEALLNSANRYDAPIHLIIDEAHRLSPNLLFMIMLFKKKVGLNGKILMLGNSTQVSCHDTLKLLKCLNGFKTIYFTSRKTIRYDKSPKLKRLVGIAENGQLTNEDMKEFNHIEEVEKDAKYILTPLNRQAKKYNNEYLERMKDKGKIDIDDLKHLNKKFRLGEKIMFLKNNNKCEVFNGEVYTLNSITEFKKAVVEIKTEDPESDDEDDEEKKDKQYILSLTDDKNIVVLKKLSMRYMDENITLAYAMTIQKVIGLTLKGKINILLEGSHGQKSLFYNAITRAELLEQISIVRYRENQIKLVNNLNQHWVNFMIGNTKQYGDATLGEIEEEKNDSLNAGYEVFKEILPRINRNLC